MKRGFAIVLTGLLGLIAGVAWLGRPAPQEPVQAGHRLSEWLDMYDSSWRFETNDGRHPPFTDAEIAAALDRIGTNALPLLQRWLVTKPARFKPWCNARLGKLGLGRFCFDVADVDYACIAEIGFQYYGTDAQPLLPWLLELSHRADRETRMTAYEAAFFTRPEREIFLPLARQALQDPAAGCEATAAQWMAERFPAEADQAGLRAQYPEYFEDKSPPESAPASSP